jgi:hypothetical protein
MFLYLFKQDWQPTRQTHSHLALTHFHAKATSSKQQQTLHCQAANRSNARQNHPTVDQCSGPTEWKIIRKCIIYVKSFIFWDATQFTDVSKECTASIFLADEYAR